MKLLDNYIFKIVPTINPDDVARGYWKNDTLGQDLNECFQDPLSNMHPTIHALKHAILTDNAQGNLKMVVDF